MERYFWEQLPTCARDSALFSSPESWKYYWTKCCTYFPKYIFSKRVSPFNHDETHTLKDTGTTLSYKTFAQLDNFRWWKAQQHSQDFSLQRTVNAVLNQPKLSSAKQNSMSACRPAYSFHRAQMDWRSWPNISFTLILEHFPHSRARSDSLGVHWLTNYSGPYQWHHMAGSDCQILIHGGKWTRIIVPQLGVPKFPMKFS